MGACLVALTETLAPKKYHRNKGHPEGARRSEFDFPPVDKEQGYEAVKVMDKIAREKEVSIPQIALGWLLHQPGVTAPIIGATKISQLEDNLKSTLVMLVEGEGLRITKITWPNLSIPGG